MNDDEQNEAILRDGYFVQWTDITDAMHRHSRGWTVGRTLRGRPELLLSGLPKEITHAILGAMDALDMATCFEPDETVGGYLVLEAEPAVALGALVKMGPATRVFQLVWQRPVSGTMGQVLHPDRDQTLYAKGSTILLDPYGDQ